MVKITILGEPVSKKNSKQLFRNSKTGKMFITSNSRVKSWETSALEQLSDFKEKLEPPLVAHYKFYVKNNIQKDLDNLICSCNDILQTANSDMGIVRGKVKPIKGTGIIVGDHWQVLSIGSASAEIDKENPRCEITLEKRIDG